MKKSAYIAMALAILTAVIEIWKDVLKREQDATVDN